MSAALRSVILTTFGALWLSGCCWLILHFCFSQTSDFGSIEHPWSPWVLKIHGWIAVASVFLLGWVTARHVSDRWAQTQKRISGVGMVGIAVLLAVTGYALYYTTDGLHDGAAVVHETIGAAAVFLALTHWTRRRTARRRSQLVAGVEPP